MLIKEVETSLQSIEIYAAFKEHPYSFFLDSGMDHSKLGAYSFIGFAPFLVFKSKGAKLEITRDGKVTKLTGNPFTELQKLLADYRLSYQAKFPFLGGAVGYFAYDLCHHLERLPRKAIDDVQIPDCHLGFYDGIIIMDHAANKVFAASLGLQAPAEQVVERIIAQIKAAEKMGVKLPYRRKTHPVEFKASFTRDQYLQAVNRVKAYIKAGDIYQANLTQRFECDLEESPFELYLKLRSINPAPFAAFMDFGEGCIVSSSPERFIRIAGRRVETRPIKGTRPRGQTAQEDRQNRAELLSSEKDKAELLMIVDLERNDLGRVCQSGTVKVEELFHLEEYATVYHLVATVTGVLKESCDAVDCLEAAFPGGSITGAPKIRAMEIIDELEPTQRNIYTGSIGYIGFNGNADLNIVIRTIVCKENKAYFQVGGGIVWDSDAELEYEEALHKARALLEALKM